MRSRIGKALLVLSLILRASSSEAAWAIANSGNNHGNTPTDGTTGTTPLTLAFAGNVTNGNLLIAAVQWGSSSGTGVFSKSAGTATDGGWTTVKTINDATNGQSLSVGYALVTASGSYTVKGDSSSTGQNFATLNIVEFSGNASASVADVNAGQTTSGTAFNSGNATTTVNGDLIYGAAADDSSGNGVVATGTGFTLLDPAVYHGLYIVTEYETQGTAGSVNAAWTNSQNDSVMAIMATFKPPGGAAACSPSLASTGAGACH